VDGVVVARGGIILAGWHPGADSYTLLDAIKGGAASATGSDRVSITPLAHRERHVPLSRVIEPPRTSFRGSATTSKSLWRCV
jgi:hypothetical protein